MEEQYESGNIFLSTRNKEVYHNREVVGSVRKHGLRKRGNKKAEEAFIEKTRTHHFDRELKRTQET
jgi:hypothetical protein